MSITYGAGPGTVISTYAANGTLLTQAQQTGDNTVVMPNTLAAANNGQIGTKYATYLGRVIIINLAGTQQKRMVIAEAAGTGTTRILTVHENWATNPISGDTYHMFYDIDDIETGGAGGGVSLSTKTGLYEFSNKLTLGTGAAAGLIVVTGTGLEINDGGASVTWIIASGARFDVGYQQSGVSVGGGIMNSVNNTDGEPTIQFQSGSTGEWCDGLLWTQLLKTLTFEHATGATVTFRNINFLKDTYNCKLFGATLYNCSFTGRRNANDFIRLSQECTVDGVVLIQTAGFHTEDADTSTETITVRNASFVYNVARITINSNKTWIMIDPTWVVTAHTDLVWLTGTANSCYDKKSVIVTVQLADSTPLADANVIIYEGTADNLVLKAVSSGAGVVSDVFTYRYFTNASTTTYSTHAFRVDKWGYIPFAAAQTSTEKRSGAVVLSDDLNIVAATQADALTDGAAITWNKDTNPSSIIAFTGGTGTLNVGDTVTGTSSGADGIVTKIVDGDSTAGTVHLKTRDANNFTGTEALSSTGWAATLTENSQQDYTIWIDSKTLSMQITYDYLAALTSQTALSATGELIHEWGNRYQIRALYKGASGYYTDRSDTKGVFVTNFGAGTIQLFTDDDGGTWTPPSQVTLSVICKNTYGNAVEGVKIRIETLGGTLIANGTTNAAGLYSAGYIYTIDVDVVVIARLKGYKNSSAQSEIEVSGMSIPFTMISDAAVDLP